MHTVARMETKETQTRFPTLQRLMGEVLSLRASYGHTGETRSESDVGVSTHRLIVLSARSNRMCRKGRDDELCECAKEVMCSLSHWQGLAAHGRHNPDRHKRPRSHSSLPFRDLGRNGLSGIPAVKMCISTAFVQTNNSATANCESRLYGSSCVSRPYPSAPSCCHY